jgi:flagellar export protein FliJ
MKRFVFRAQAALDLRRKQEDEAKRALAVAELQEREAQSALDAAQKGLDDMLQRAGQGHASDDLTAHIWRRNWVVGQRQLIDRCRMVLRERHAAVVEATRLAQLAGRKAKSLERFRDRAWRQHTREDAREEQKALDELGVIRFALGRSLPGEHS